MVSIELRENAVSAEGQAVEPNASGVGKCVAEGRAGMIGARSAATGRSDVREENLVLGISAKAEMR